MSENTIKFCSFCGAHKDEVNKLIVSDDVAICNNCIELCNDLLHNDANYVTNKTQPKIFDPQEIKAYLDELVVGQETTKIILSVAITNHYKRINNPRPDMKIHKGNVLLVGPTGSGKTFLAQNIAKLLDVPFVIADVTRLTESGYVGDDVETMLSMLLAAADNDVARAEHGIIFIDEVDKLARKSDNPSLTRDVSGEGVQQALLKILEGTVSRVQVMGKRKHSQTETVEINTGNILFIAGGAFVGLEKIVKDRIGSKTIGFNAEIKEEKPISPLSLIAATDLYKYGLIPEFVGRFTTVTTLEQLSVNQLIGVMTSVKNNLVDQYKHIFSIDGIDLDFTVEATKKIAQNCIDIGTGARGLQNELERILLPHMFNIRRYKEIGLFELLITEDLVDYPISLF